MGITFCCDRQPKKQINTKDNGRPSRKELLTFVQNRGFFPSGISADLHTNLLAGGAEPMEIVDHNLRPRRFSSARRSIPRRLNFEDFEVITKIGEGGFGKVFLVERKDTEKLYAMKILNKAKLDHVYHKMHTISERQILQNVNSPFVVKLHAAFQNSKNLYLVLEYLPGGSLFDHLRKREILDEDEARFYISEIILALEDLHNRNIIYRDLKPENILIDANGHIKLTDFGLSKQGVISGTKAYTTCGTAEYLAPEMLSGKGHDKAVDWWSLGCILYQMLIGDLPHTCSTGNKMQLFKQICNKPVNIPENLSKEVQGLLKDLLQIDPKQRLRDIDKIKQHEFFATVDWEKIKEKQVTPPHSPGRKEKLSPNSEAVQSELESTNVECSNPGSYTNFAGFTYYKSLSDLSD